jgi:hypothetical protein
VQNSRFKKVWWGYYLAFYVLWAFSTVVIIPHLDELPNKYIGTLVKSGVLKNLVWTLPSAILIKKYQENVQITLKNMFQNKVKWLNYLPIFVVFGIYILGTTYLQTGSIKVSNSFHPSDFIVVLFVGITEEMVFRGWLLNASVKGKSEDETQMAVLLNAVMFLAIHFPRWYMNGVLVTNFTNLGFLQIMLLSCIFSYTFLKSKNILVPVFLHMFWDLLVYMFF